MYAKIKFCCRNGLRLSVSNNIDILREKLMKEMARRKEAEKAAPEVSIRIFKKRMALRKPLTRSEFEFSKIRALRRPLPGSAFEFSKKEGT
jgi:hypothetical protein